MAQFLTFILDASNYILILMLVALGLAIIFGLMNVINMAHGEFLMLGAYTVLLMQNIGAGFWVGLMVAPLVVGLVGLVIEELVISRIYHRVLDTILATWGLSLLIKQTIVLVYGPGSYSITVPIPSNIEIFGQPYPLYRLFVMGLAVVVVGFTFWLFFKTRYGLAARGVIANRSMADCLGINTRALDRQTFFLGSAMAGLAGAAMSPLISLDPQMGLGFLVPAFLAILIGGLGSIIGPLVGATTVGLSDNLTTTLLSPVWSQLVVFLVAIIIIRLFPRGLLAKKGRDV